MESLQNLICDRSLSRLSWSDAVFFPQQVLFWVENSTSECLWRPFPPRSLPHSPCTLLRGVTDTSTSSSLDVRAPICTHEDDVLSVWWQIHDCLLLAWNSTYTLQRSTVFWSGASLSSVTYLYLVLCFLLFLLCSSLLQSPHYRWSTCCCKTWPHWDPDTSAPQTSCHGDQPCQHGRSEPQLSTSSQLHQILAALSLGDGTTFPLFSCLTHESFIKAMLNNWNLFLPSHKK